MNKKWLGLCLALAMMGLCTATAADGPLKVKIPGKIKPVVMEEQGRLYASPDILKAGGKWDVQVEKDSVFAVVPGGKSKEGTKVPLAVTTLEGAPFIDLSFFAKQSGLSFSVNDKKRSISIEKQKEKKKSPHKEVKKKDANTQVRPILLMWDPDLRYNGGSLFFSNPSARRIISPTWGSYHFFDSGKNIPDLEYLNAAKKENIEVMPLVHNDFDVPATSKLMHDPGSQTELQDKMAAYSEVYGLAGYNIDFENMDPKDASKFTDFISGISSRLHEIDKQVTVDITVYNETSSTWSMCYDRWGLAGAADYEVVMGYDQTPAGSRTAGPNSSWDWLDRNVHILLQQIPPEKLILGLPLYTRIWETEGNKTKAKTLTMRYTPEILRKSGIRMRRSRKDKQYIASWQACGKSYQVWVEDAISLKEKAKLADMYKLAGLAFWRYGFEQPGLYGQIESVLFDEADDEPSYVRVNKRDTGNKDTKTL